MERKYSFDKRQNLDKKQTYTVLTGYAPFEYHVKEILSPSEVAEFDEETNVETMSLVSAMTDEKKPIRKSSLTVQEFLKWRKMVLIISYVSLAFQVGICAVSIGIGVSTNSSGVIGYGIDVGCDIMSTIVIIWQYAGPAGSSYSWQRELKSTLILSILMILMAFIVLGKAAYNFVHEVTTVAKWELFAICDISLVVYPILAAFKFIVAQKIKSSAFMIDAICSIIASITAAAVLASLIIFWFFPVWYIDPIVAVLISIFMIGYAIRQLWVLKKKTKNYEEKQHATWKKLAVDEEDDKESFLF